MNQYKEARERTKAKIENAYWDLMMNGVHVNGILLSKRE